MKDELVPIEPSDLLYRFTPEEKALLARRLQAYNSALSFIAELHGLTGPLEPLEDGFKKGK